MRDNPSALPFVSRHRRAPRRLTAVGIAAALLVAACGSDDDEGAGATAPPATEAPAATDAPAATEPPPTEAPPATDAPVVTEAPPTTQAPTTTEEPPPPEPGLELRFTGLPILGSAAVYEGWAIVDGAALTTGRFLIDETGAVVDEAGAAVESFAVDATTASAFILTIEPADDPDPGPSETHIVGGDFVDGTAELTIAHPGALGTDFADAAGSVEVAVPTARDVPGAETSGIWFFSEGSGSLTLPVLPAGWVYEGWTVFDGIPVSTGRFVDTNAADDNRQYSGDGDGPATPGEDFIRNAPEGLTFPTTVAGTTVVVSVEPDPDDSPDPFAIKPLSVELPDEVAPFQEFDLINVGAETFPSYPTGTARVITS